MTPRLTYLRWGLLVLLLVVPALSASAQRSDVELLREVVFEGPRGDRSVEYGLEPGRETLSPTYHLTSSLLWVWENLVAPDICSPGGYTDTNTHYLKALWGEYGGLGALLLYSDRIVRNTRIGRASSPTNNLGLIKDDPKRYRR